MTNLGGSIVFQLSEKILLIIACGSMSEQKEWNSWEMVAAKAEASTAASAMPLLPFRVSAFLQGAYLLRGGSLCTPVDDSRDESSVLMKNPLLPPNIEPSCDMYDK